MGAGRAAKVKVETMAKVETTREAEKAGRKDADTTVTTDAAKATPKSKVERMSASLPIRSKGWRLWNRFNYSYYCVPPKKKKEESCVFPFDEQPSTLPCLEPPCDGRGYCPHCILNEWRHA